MRWFSFFILAYLMLGLQIGLGGIPPVGSGLVNFVLIAAVFTAINAQRDAAIIACFVLGMLQDIVGMGPIGTYALAYSLIAILMSGSERSLSVEHPFTHFFVTLFGGVVTAILLQIHGRFAMHGTYTPFLAKLLGAFYTAVVALPVLWGLSKVRKSFKFKTSVGR